MAGMQTFELSLLPPIMCVRRMLGSEAEPDTLEWDVRPQEVILNASPLY